MESTPPFPRTTSCYQFLTNAVKRGRFLSEIVKLGFRTKGNRMGRDEIEVEIEIKGGIEVSFGLPDPMAVGFIAEKEVVFPESHYAF